MSWCYANKLEEQLRRGDQELLRRTELADAEDEPEIDIPDELARRKGRLAAIKKAKEEIERRARERLEAEPAKYEEKLKRRKEKEEKTSRMATYPSHRRPAYGRMTRSTSRMNSHASCGHQINLCRPTRHRPPPILTPI